MAGGGDGGGGREIFSVVVDVRGGGLSGREVTRTLGRLATTADGGGAVTNGNNCCSCSRLTSGKSLELELG